MPTKFTSVFQDPQSGLQIRFKPEVFEARRNDVPGMGSLVGEAVGFARNLCRRTLSILNGALSPVVIEHARSCFRVSDATEFAGIIDHVRKIVDLTANGLQGETAIKVKGLSELGGEAGSVKYHPGDDNSLAFNALMRSIGETAKSNTLKIFSHSDKGEEEPVLASQIHISSWVLDKKDKDLSTRVIIHEATHRFAGTNDANVDGSKTPNGYFEDDGSQPRFPNHLTAERAIWNADSYAWFIFKTAKALENSSIYAMRIN